ncbi:SUZ domain-containing protein 2 [Elsinoe australis]|uniref:SUZ domain-containing protein 2 n=1 Tax=Elsinoe australis TaxID=40998 RepID=A0A4U7AL25_9PEZI|nr:SUZ domain-containing protein 2 [Elsinoe australis]
MSTDAAKPKLTFAKVAATRNVNPPAIARGSALPPTSALPLSAKATEVARPDEGANGLESTDHGLDMDKFTPRQTKSTLASSFVASQPGIPSATSQVRSSRQDEAVPVSEENVTKLPSMRPPPSTISQDGKSTTSGTTFPLDEKESLRPDDSASVQAGEEEDGRGSTQPSSRIGSDSGARAFSEQLREISIMGPPSKPPAVMARMNSANAVNAGVLYSPSPIAVPNALNGVSVALNHDQNTLSGQPDEKLLEALNSIRDRVWVLKLEQDITDFVKDPAAQMFDLPQCNSFYRMLAHKMADYYLLGHTMDASLATVRLWKTPNCRIPPRLSDITNPSTAASTPPPPMPQMKILRRSENGTRPSSRDGNGEGDSESDLGKNKFPATREEREARYEAARLRILGSAKPAEEAAAAAAPPKDESNSNSVVGKKKTRKQRTDSEDGFEARSAYSMYAPGSVAQVIPSRPQGYQQPENMPVHHNGYMPYGMPSPYGNGYGPNMDHSQSQQPWYPQQYPPMPQQPQTWSQEQYGNYDMANHMQGMSIHQPSMMQGYPPQMGPSGSPHYGSPGQMPAYPAYGNMPQSYPDQYQGPFPQPQQQYQNGQIYAYGMLPSQNNGVKRQNPNHPLPGSFNRQYFNPQSQAFVPTQNASPYRPPYPASFSPAMSHASASYGGPQHLQRQYSSQSNPHGPPQPQTLTQPNPQTLTHPLPQPVYTQNGPQPSPGHNGNRDKASPSPLNSGLPRESSIAKFAAPSLPAKPPPPINDSVRFNPAHLNHGAVDPANMNGARKSSPRGP